VHSAILRRRARECALQFLFGLEFTGNSWKTDIGDYWKHFPARPGAKAYAEHLIRGVCEHREALDEQIMECLEKWTPDRVGRIERTILRIALFEMTHVPDVPVKVALNEAIEVAKRFGSEESPRFINGVLDRLAQKMRDADTL